MLKEFFLGCRCIDDHILRVYDRNILTNFSWGFHQTYNLGAVGDEDELVRFRDETVKGQDHDETKYRQKRQLLGNFKGHEFKCYIHRQPFWQRHTGRCFAIRDLLVCRFVDLFVNNFLF